MFFEIAKVSQYTSATFEGKFVTKNCKKSPNLDTLVRYHEEKKSGPS